MMMREIRIGDSQPILEQRSWGLVCRSVARGGYDKALVSIPVAVLASSGANLHGTFLVLAPNRDEPQFAGYIHRASLDKSGESVRIVAKGWRHTLSRLSAPIKRHGLESPELAFYLAQSSGLDASGVQGYEPAPRRYRVTKAVQGLRANHPQGIGDGVMQPILGSDESTLIKLLQLQRGVTKRNPWSRDTIASTDVTAHSLWEAMYVGDPNLFETAALVQYQWLIGSPDRFLEGRRISFVPYWKAPYVALSDTSLVRRLHGGEGALYTRSPKLHRRASRLSGSEMSDALARAGKQAQAMTDKPPAWRRGVLNAVHLFIRATEVKQWDDALIFYSCAADEVANLAPKSRLFSKNDRKLMSDALATVFEDDDERRTRAESAIARINERSFREKIRAVAEANGVELSDGTLDVVDDLYLMRNDLVHAGRQPLPVIIHSFATGLSALDQIISRIINTAA